MHRKGQIHLVRQGDGKCLVQTGLRFFCPSLCMFDNRQVNQLIYLRQEIMHFFGYVQDQCGKTAKFVITFAEKQNFTVKYEAVRYCGSVKDLFYALRII